MQASEMDLIAMVVGLVLAGQLFIVIRRRRVLDSHTLEAQRPWRRYSTVLGILHVATLVSFAGALNAGWFTHSYEAIFGVALTAVVGVALIWVSLMELRAADEFIQKVAIESLALAFALSFVGILARAQLMAADMVSDLGALGVFHVMIYAFLVARITVYLRYR